MWGANVNATATATATAPLMAYVNAVHAAHGDLNVDAVVAVAERSGLGSHARDTLTFFFFPISHINIKITGDEVAFKRKKMLIVDVGVCESEKKGGRIAIFALITGGGWVVVDECVTVFFRPCKFVDVLF